MSSEYEKLAWYRDAATRGNLEALKVLLTRVEHRGDWSVIDPQVFEHPSSWREIWKKLTELLSTGNANGISGLCYAAKLWKAETVQQVEKLAEQGNTEASMTMGQLYEHGINVPQNKEQAAEWYGKAAQRGYSEAYVAVCRLAEQGIGKAVSQVKELATQSNTEAYMTMGQLYEHGTNVPQNKELAAEWYGKAVQRGNSDAYVALCRLAKQGVREAVHPVKELAEHGNTEASMTMGQLYEHGTNVPQNKEQAAEWYGKAAQRGYSEAYASVCRLAEQGIGKAVSQVKELAQQGRQYACKKLGRMYEYGRGVPQNKEQAAEWYGKAALRGNSNDYAALYRLAEQGISAAVQQIKRLAEHGNTTACIQMGAMYENGRGVLRDYVVAIFWYDKAAKQGAAEAKEALRRLGR